MTNFAGAYARRPAYLRWLVFSGIMACGSDSRAAHDAPDETAHGDVHAEDVYAAQEESTAVDTLGADAAADSDIDGGTTPDGAAGPQDGGSELYRKVSDIIARSCSFHRCHAGPVMGGGLNFGLGMDYRSQLVNVQACAYDGMKEVEPYAPWRSWLMVKLTAEARPLEDPYGTYIYFDPPEGWDPTKRRCVDQTDDGTPLFGQRMPATAPNMLPPEEIEIFRRWIAQGAQP